MRSLERHVKFKDRLHAGELLLGPMVTLGSPAVSEMLSHLGYDWLFIDAEHSPMEAGDIQPLLQASNVPCLIRTKDSNPTTLKKALDIGPVGVIVPQVNSAHEARDVVAACKYHGGTRGVGIARAHGFGVDFAEYVSRADESTVIVVQAEHYKAVEEIDAIAATDGIDGILVGPYDLSSSLGVIGQVDHPSVVDAVRTISEAAKKAGKRLGFFGLNADAVKPAIDDGFTLIAVGVDTAMLAGASKLMLDELRSYVQ